MPFGEIEILHSLQDILGDEAIEPIGQDVGGDAKASL
jgi:hypothetical protein